MNLIKKSTTILLITILSATTLAAAKLKRITQKEEKLYVMEITGMLYIDKPLTNGSDVSENITKFKKFDIADEFSDDFYAGYLQFEHNYYLLPYLKADMSSYSFEKVSQFYEETQNNVYTPIDYYSYISTEEQNFMVYWEILEGTDMQLNVGGQYKIIKGHLISENLSTYKSGEYGEITFEKYLPMVYLRGDMQLAYGVELSNEWSVGIDKEETFLETNFYVNYYTKIGLIGMVGYKYKHQEFLITDNDIINDTVKFTNNTHSLIVGLGYKW
jgi:hypothetical protein